MNIDPLAEKYYNLSTYNYSLNNPIYFVDPDGRGVLDFFDQDGNNIGKSDKHYVVTSQTDVDLIKNNTANGVETKVGDLKGNVEQLPSDFVRGEMKKSVDNSNNPTTASMNPDPNFKPDTKGGFHEEGARAGKDANGNEVVEHMYPGSASDPSVDSHASVTIHPTQARDGSYDIDHTQGEHVEWHVHPKGSLSKGFSQDPSAYVFEVQNNSVKQIISGDLPNSKGSNTTRYVLGAGNNAGGQKVYIYRNGSNVASFPLPKFFNIRD